MREGRLQGVLSEKIANSRRGKSLGRIGHSGCESPPLTSHDQPTGPGDTPTLLAGLEAAIQPAHEHRADIPQPEALKGLKGALCYGVKEDQTSYHDVRVDLPSSGAGPATGKRHGPHEKNERQAGIVSIDRTYPHIYHRPTPSKPIPNAMPFRCFDPVDSEPRGARTEAREREGVVRQGGVKP